MLYVCMYVQCTYMRRYILLGCPVLEAVNVNNCVLSCFELDEKRFVQLSGSVMR